MQQTSQNPQPETQTVRAERAGPETEKRPLPLSPSIRQAVGRVRTKDPISAVTLVEKLLQLHPEYGANRAATAELEETPATRTAAQWVEAARALFDDESIRTAWGAREAATFHGRLLVIGLALLEPQLRRQLESVDAFTPLVNELIEPLAEILNERGRVLFNPPQKPADLLDTVPNWSDDPVLRPDQDLLGRAAFARFLAKRIAARPKDSNAYSIHVYGPWGAGKSSLLNFLRQELSPVEAKQGWLARLRSFIGKAWSLALSLFGRGHPSRKHEEWIVVEFNAWQNQKIQPPWWSLMERIYKQTKNRLNPWERFTEFWWRFNSGRLPYFIVAIGLALLFAYVLLPWLRTTAAAAGGLKAFGESAEYISKILALAATIWGGIFAVNRSLLFGSARAAQNYTELTRDPTSEIREKFTGLIEKLNPKRVAILIDDLDRCQSRYVVDLLEGMQTLFRQAPVVFVVAADRRWINACYEDVYGRLETRIREPGKPLGTLFLEKAFRFSTPMPGIPEKLKEYYWQYLLQVSADQWQADVTSARQNASQELRNAQSETQVRELLASGGRSFPEERALREEAAVKLASPEVLERIEHTLRPYASLLEPNPRGMKLLVNGYSANRAVAILAEVDIDLHQLALWTILSSRWPQFADYLAEHPEMLEKINQGDATVLPEGLKALALEQSLRDVLKGGPTTTSLTRETLEQSVRMRS